MADNQKQKSAAEIVKGDLHVLTLSEVQVEQLLDLNLLLDGLEKGFEGYAPPEGELPKEMAQLHSLFVETRDAFEQPPVGCGELAGLDPDSGTELGEMLLGVRPGRISDTEITVYKAMGIAMEDMVAANLAYERANQEGVGAYIVL